MKEVDEGDGEGERVPPKGEEEEGFVGADSADTPEVARSCCCASCCCCCCCCGERMEEEEEGEIPAVAATICC